MSKVVIAKGVSYKIPGAHIETTNIRTMEIRMALYTWRLKRIEGLDAKFLSLNEFILLVEKLLVQI